MKMNAVDVKSLAFKDCYKILIGTVVPRPIAWVSTVSEKGIFNVAPFSFYTAVCSNPPTLLFCPVHSAEGGEKDTLRNIRHLKEFVVNVATVENVDVINKTSTPYPPEMSEFDATGLTPIAGVKVKAPRVAQSPIQLECRLTQIIAVGATGPGGGHVVMGEVVYAHIAEHIVDDHLHINTRALNPLSRLAGTDYADIGDIFARQRPSVADIE